MDILRLRLDRGASVPISDSNADPNGHSQNQSAELEPTMEIRALSGALGSLVPACQKSETSTGTKLPEHVAEWRGRRTLRQPIS